MNFHKFTSIIVIALHQSEAEYERNGNTTMRVRL